MWQNAIKQNLYIDSFAYGDIVPYTLHNTTTISDSGYEGVLGWKLSFYATYNEGRDGYNNKIINDVRNVYAFGPSNISISNFEYNTRLIDGQRTIACNTSVLLTVKTPIGVYDKFTVQRYMEWYLSGGGRVF